MIWKAARRLAVAASALATALLVPAWADSGYYLSAELGLQASPAMLLDGGDTDRSARCDEFVNPRYAEIALCVNADRHAGAVDDWMSEFDRAYGVAGGVAVGWRRQRGRLELEWFARNAHVGQSASILSPDGVAFTTVFGSELPQAEERVRRLRSRHWFVNGYWSFPNRTRFTPYVGAGVGVADARLTYRALWRRSDDPNTVRSASGLPNEEEVKRNLAGTESRAEDELRDRLRGYQLLGGVEYAWRERLSLSIQARWTRFGAFEAGGPYDELRGHVSNLRRDGSEPVTYRVRTGDTSLFALGLRLSRRY